MPGSTVDSGMGTTIVAGTSGFTGNLLSVKVNAGKRKVIDTSHMGTTAASTNEVGNMTAILSDLSGGGEVTFDVHFNTGQSGVTAQPPLNRVAETWTITWPKTTGDNTAATWAFSGGCTSYEVDDSMEEAIKASVTVAILSKITVTAAT